MSNNKLYAVLGVILVLCAATIVWIVATAPSLEVEKHQKEEQQKERLKEQQAQKVRAEQQARDEEVQGREESAAGSLRYFREHSGYIFDSWSKACYLVFTDSTYQQTKGSISQVDCDKARGMLAPTHRAALEKYEAGLK